MPYRRFANQEYRNALQSWVEIPALLRALPVARGCRLLEVGCGRGVALTELARRCQPSRLVGIDIAPDLIALAQARLAHFGVSAELQVGDVRQLPFADGEFNVVIDFGTCYHIDQPGAALRQIARVLAAGGVFIHELPLAQLIAHPLRSGGRDLPWSECAELTGERRAGLWGSRRKAVVT
ncbi:MAG TPA: class I SAM-dependent methyltransferase [Gemmatimonadaceae bacterium]|jgi:ubiquinone/menaquinone biosynthesis C-methylase UbiE